MSEVKILIVAEYGVHARPATKLVSLANTYDCELILKFQEKSVNMKSIMGVMSLGLYKGSSVIISANGSDEIEAINDISDFVIHNQIGRLSHE